MHSFKQTLNLYLRKGKDILLLQNVKLFNINFNIYHNSIELSQGEKSVVMFATCHLVHVNSLSCLMRLNGEP